LTVRIGRTVCCRAVGTAGFAPLALSLLLGGSAGAQTTAPPPQAPPAPSEAADTAPPPGTDSVQVMLTLPPVSTSPPLGAVTVNLFGRYSTSTASSSTGSDPEGEFKNARK